MTRAKHIAQWAVLAMGVATVAYSAGRASADGIPADEPLSYSGMLLEGDEVVNGSRNVTVNIWRDAESTAVDQLVCTTEAAGVAIRGGAFRLAMPAECVEAIRSETDLWSELTVEGLTFARRKIGAAPYALTADVAAVAGDAQFAESGVAGFAVGQNLVVDNNLTAGGASLNRVKASTLRAGNDALVVDETGVRAPSLDTVEQFSSEILQLTELRMESSSALAGSPTSNFTDAVFEDSLAINAAATLDDMRVGGDLSYNGPTRTVSVNGNGTQWLDCAPGAVVGFQAARSSVGFWGITGLICTGL